MSKIFLITLVVIILVNILTATPLLQIQVLRSIVSEDRDQSNAPPGVDPNECIPGNGCPPECPEGFIPATAPLNPQLGCVPERITSNTGVQSDRSVPPESMGGIPTPNIKLR
ncbi:hypothetical protein BH23THE1_BH23THE1_31320 [soil metagenome]